MLSYEEVLIHVSLSVCLLFDQYRRWEIISLIGLSNRLEMAKFKLEKCQDYNVHSYYYVII